MATQIAQRRFDSRSILSLNPHQYSEHVPELYLRAFVDSHSAGMAVLNEVGTILYVNRGWREFAVHHRQPSDLYPIGGNYLSARRRASDALPAESEALAIGVNQVLLGRETEFQDEYLNRDASDRRWIRVHAGRFDLPAACRVLVTHEDVTESKQKIEGRQRAAEHLQRLLDATRILPWEADFETSQFTYVGEQAVSILGYPLEDWYQPDFWPAHLYEADRDRTMSNVLDYLTTRDNYEVEYRMVARDGHVVWLHNVVSVTREDGHPKTVRGFSIDVTESKEREAVLRDLSGRLIDAQEEERRRVARELHDDLNQRMAILSIEMEQLGQEFGKHIDLCRRLKHLQAQTREISADIHRLSYKLHPSKLDHLGLAPAVKSLCEELAGTGKLKVEYKQSGFPANLPKEITLCVFRVAQESLRNSVKHSGAEVARVTLNHSNGEVRLSVSDDGRGFEMQSEAMRKGLGFTSMRERLRLVNGKISINSQPGKGTRIEVTVPLEKVPDTVFSP